MTACLFPVLVLAQTVTDRAPMPVQRALQTAWQDYPGYRATQAQLAAAQARRTAAGQPLYNPELELAAEDEGPDRRATLGVDLTLDLSGKLPTPGWTSRWRRHGYASGISSANGSSAGRHG